MNSRPNKKAQIPVHKVTKAAVAKVASRYPISVRWSEEDGAFIATIHGLAGDVCHGSNPDTVFKKAHEIALELAEDAIKGAICLPLPSQAKGSTVAVRQARPKEVRDELNISQADFAEMLGISLSTYINWENNVRKPTGAGKSLLKIAAARPDVVRQVLGAGLE